MNTITSPEEFNSALTSATEKPLVAFFSAQWCSGCKMVAPKIATLAEELEASATFVKVNAEELNSLCDEVEVDSFPHFRVYKQEKILGDYTSSKFDKVNAFIRTLVAPDTLETLEETPEGTTEEDATEKEDADAETAADDGSRKRQERDDMESNDDHVAKKVKTDVEALNGTEKENVAGEANVEEAVVPEEVAEEVKKVEETQQVKEKQLDESVSIDKVESCEVPTASDAAAA